MAEYLAKYVSPEFLEELELKDTLYEKLVSKIPYKHIRRDLLSYRGISVEKLNEIVHAINAKTVAVDGVGHDFADGSEAKFVTLGARISKTKYKDKVYETARYAFTIGNLATKTGDIRLTVNVPHKDEVRFFNIPFSTWTKMMYNNSVKSRGSIEINISAKESADLPDWLLECEFKMKSYA